MTSYIFKLEVLTMKKILLTALLLVPFVNASENIEILDYDSDTEIVVYCISGYVFLELGKKKAGGGLTQVMDRHGSGTKATMFPMTCEQYMKVYKEK